MRQVKELLVSEYQDQIWDITFNTMQEYKLIEENDHIAIYIEGDRNSLLTHACVELYKELTGVNIETTYLLVPSERVSLEQLVQIARDWGIKQYHVVDDKTENGYMEYCRRRGCNKILIDLNRTRLMEKYMAKVMEEKKFFNISPIYQMTRYNYLTAIHPFFFVEEKDMKHFSTDCEEKVLPCAANIEKVKLNGTNDRTETKNVVRLNVYQGV